jgi:ankyrin repeat protein
MSGGDWKQLFKGVQDNDFELVRFYLRSGIDPNYQHPEYMALPLSESIRYKHLDIAELLLQNGANPLITEMESGLTPVSLAAKLGDERFVELLAAHGKPVNS